jgi:hypothetical protein
MLDTQACSNAVLLVRTVTPHTNVQNLSHENMLAITPEVTWIGPVIWPGMLEWVHLSHSACMRRMLTAASSSQQGNQNQ